MTYEERVEKVAKALFDVVSTEQLGVEDYFTVYAAIELQADAIREGNRHWGIPGAWTESYLEQHGYIPEKEEEQ